MPTPTDELTALPRREAIARIAGGTLAITMPRTAMAETSVASAQPAIAELAQLLPLAGVPSISIARVDGARITTNALGVQRAGEREPVGPDTV